MTLKVKDLSHTEVSHDISVAVIAIQGILQTVIHINYENTSIKP